MTKIITTNGDEIGNSPRVYKVGDTIPIIIHDSTMPEKGTKQIGELKVVEVAQGLEQIAIVEVRDASDV